MCQSAEKMIYKRFVLKKNFFFEHFIYQKSTFNLPVYENLQPNSKFFESSDMHISKNYSLKV